MSKELTGMIEAQAQAESAFAFAAERFGPAPISAARADAGMRAALLWLASNVSDEMVKAASAVWKNDQNSGSFEELFQFVIAAALRQAASTEEK